MGGRAGQAASAEESSGGEAGCTEGSIFNIWALGHQGSHLECGENGFLRVPEWSVTPQSSYTEVSHFSSCLS